MDSAWCTKQGLVAHADLYQAVEQSKATLKRIGVLSHRNLGVSNTCDIKCVGLRNPEVAGHCTKSCSLLCLEKSILGLEYVPKVQCTMIKTAGQDQPIR